MPENSGANKVAMSKDLNSEELLLAREAVQTLVKASKAFRIYLPNNPIHQQFFNKFKECINSFVNEYGTMRIDVSQFGFIYSEKSVYENKDPKDSLPFKLFSDGIVSIIFNAGIEDVEIKDFIDILGSDLSDNVDEDLVTRLWVRSFSNIHYALSEENIETDSEGIVAEALSISEKETEGLRHLHSNLPDGADFSGITFPGDFLSLSDEDKKCLQRGKELEKSKNHIVEVINILSAILTSEKDPVIFGEFVQIVANLAQSVLHSGEIKTSIWLINFLRKLPEKRTLSPEQSDALTTGISGILDDEFAEQLANTVNEGKLKPEEFKGLIVFLGNDAVPAICQILALVEKKGFRKIIIDTLVEVGRGNVEAFLPCLKDKRWYLLRNIIHIIRRIGKPPYLGPIVRLASHPDTRVRKELANYLNEIPGGRGQKDLLKFLDDSNRNNRIHALRLIASSRHKDTLKLLLESIKKATFEEKDISEKVAFYEAIGSLGSQDVVPMLKDMLLKKHWFGKGKEREYALCSVAGLKKIRSAEAMTILYDAYSAKSGEVRDIISAAVTELEKLALQEN